MLKNRWIYIRLGAVFFLIFILPYLLFLIQDAKIINVVKQMKILPVSVSSDSNDSDLKLSDKLNLIGAKDVEQVELKMGEIFSLYEARKQCFNELCKIPILEMDVYGPVRDEINITPKLFIDTKAPSSAMIAWTGTVRIKEVTYKIALDEVSKKLILLEAAEGGEERKKEIEEAIKNDWEKYLQP